MVPFCSDGDNVSFLLTMNVGDIDGAAVVWFPLAVGTAVPFIAPFTPVGATVPRNPVGEEVGCPGTKESLNVGPKVGIGS